MPEYIALVHYHSQGDDEIGPPPSVDDMTAAFMRMDRCGVARVH